MDAELNSSISDSKCTLFLGAGASAPLGLKPTAPFLDLLSIKLKPVIELEINKQLDDKQHKEVLDSLFSQAAAFYGVTAPDSEVILDYISSLSKICIDLHNLPGLFRELAGTTGVSDFHKRWSDMLVKVSGQIKKVIVEHYSEVDGQKAWTLYSDLLKPLCGFGHVLPVFTTNYDWVFELLAETRDENVNLVDGFTTGRPMGDCWSKTVFKKFRPDMNKMNLVLFKLHGSTSWYRDQSPPKNIRKFAHPSTVLAGSEAVLIYPTQVKAEAVRGDPFKTAYEYLRQTLVRTNLCIIIGFSFRDPAINETFHSAFIKNSEFRLVVVEPSMDEEAGMSLNWLIGKLGVVEKEAQRRIKVIKKRFGEDPSVYQDIARAAQDFVI